MWESYCGTAYAGQCGRPGCAIGGEHAHAEVSGFSVVVSAEDAAAETWAPSHVATSSTQTFTFRTSPPHCRTCTCRGPQ